MANDVPKFEDTTPIEPSFEDTVPVDSKAKEFALPETIAAKLAEGASFNLSPQLAGGLSAAGRVAGIEGLGGPIKDIGLADSPTLDLETILNSYRASRDKEQAMLRSMQQQHPATSIAANVAGGLGTGKFIPNLVNVGQAAPLAAKAGAGAINMALPSVAMSAAASPVDLTKGTDLTPEELLQFSGDVGMGTALGMGMGASLPLAGKVLEKPKQLAGDKLKDLSSLLDKFAQKRAIQATQAAPNKVEKFEPGAGKELLDRGIVKFGSTVENIADNAKKAVDAAGNNISSALNQLDQQGVKVSRFDIINDLKAKISQFKGDESKADVVKELELIIENIRNTKTPEMDIGTAERIKRGFGDKIANWADPASGKANKEAYLTYMRAVENAAEGANPELANLFKEGKETYKLLSPIEEAAQRKASQANQQSYGSVGDMVAAASGAAMGGTPGAIASVIAKKALLPRVPSSLAVTSNKLGKAVGQVGEALSPTIKTSQDFLKKGVSSLANATPETIQQVSQQLAAKGPEGQMYGKMLEEAAGKNSISRNAMIFGLMQKKEFRQLFDVSDEDEQK